MTKKSKKGFLLGEFTLKLIIAIMGILLLAYLLFRLYSVFSSGDDLKKAQATLDDLSTKMNSVSTMADGQGQSYILLSPKSWVLVNYPKGDPDFCKAQGCLCICKAAGWGYTQLAQCNDKNVGACKVIARSIVMSPSEFAIEPTGISIKNQGGIVTITKQ